MKKNILAFLCMAFALGAHAQKRITATSPDGRIVTTVTLGDKLN